MRKQRTRGLKIEVEKRLNQLIGGGWTAAQIHRQLEEEFPGEVPTDRTIRQYVKRLNPQDPSGPWSLAEGGEEAAFLLSVLRMVVEHSEGRIVQLTRNQAAWIERIRIAVPDIPAATAFLFAREYVRCEVAGQDSAHLDMALALSPIVGEAKGSLPAPDLKEVRTRITRHIDLHVRLWPGRNLAMWARGNWMATEYQKAAEGRGGHVIAWDDRKDVKFLQLRF